MIKGHLVTVALLVAACSAPPSGRHDGPRVWVAEARSSQAGDTKSAFFDAWAGGDAAALAAVLTADFEGTDLTQRRAGVPHTASGVTRTEWRGAPAPLPAPAFIESVGRWRSEWRVEDRDVHTWEVDVPKGGGVRVHTLEHARFFGALPDGRRREDRVHVELVLDEVAPAEWRVSRVSVREGWTQTAPAGSFVDVTDAVLPPGYDQSGAQMYTDAGPSLADADGDGDVDLVLPRMHAPLKLYLNDDGAFDDATESAGLALSTLSSGTNAALFIDHDADGDLDLVVGDRDVGIHLLVRDGTRYRAHPGSPFGGAGPWESLVAADYDGDGALDVFACAYGRIDADHQPGSYVDALDGAPNLLLRNAGSAGFEDATAAAGLSPHARRWSYSAGWADYDRDGDLDLYVANDYGPNQLLRNDGARFVDVAAESGAEDRGNGMSVSWFDANGDARLDLYVSNMQSFAGNRITRSPDFPGSPETVALYGRFAQGNTLLRGLADGTFEDGTAGSGAKPAYWAWGAVPFDHDSDGDLDLLCVTGMYTGPTSGDT